MSRTKRPSKNKPPLEIGDLVEATHILSSRVPKGMLGIVIDTSFVDNEWFATVVFDIDTEKFNIYSNYLKKVKE